MKKSLDITIVITINTLFIGAIIYFPTLQNQSYGSPLFLGWGLLMLIFGIGVFVFDLIYLQGLRGNLKCPNCNGTIRAGGLGRQPKENVTCKCGAQIGLAHGLLHPHIMDWKLSDDSQPEQEGIPSMKEKALDQLDQRVGNWMDYILNLMILVLVTIGLIAAIVMLFDVERGGQATVNNLHIILIVFLTAIDSYAGFILVRSWKMKRKKG